MWFEFNLRGRPSSLPLEITDTEHGGFKMYFTSLELNAERVSKSRIADLKVVYTGWCK